MPEQQDQDLVAQADAVQPQQITPQIGAGVQVDVHGIAGQGAQEQTCRTDRQRFARAVQG